MTTNKESSDERCPKPESDIAEINNQVSALMNGVRREFSIFISELQTRRAICRDQARTITAQADEIKRLREGLQLVAWKANQFDSITGEEDLDSPVIVSLNLTIRQLREMRAASLLEKKGINQMSDKKEHRWVGAGDYGGSENGNMVCGDCGREMEDADESESCPTQEDIYDPICETCPQLRATILSLEQKLERVNAMMVSLFTQGYKRGHHDTVEGCYIDIKPVDEAIYFLEDVAALRAASIALAEIERKG